MISTAVALAKSCDVVLLCVGLDEIMESEGMDRQSMALSAGQQTLIKAVCEANGNVVLVLSGGSPFEIPDGKWSGMPERNDAICQLYYAKTGFARLVYKILTNMKNKADAKGTPDLNILFVYNMPFRAIGKMAGGMVSDAMVDDIVFLVNGHFWRGLGRLIRDFNRNNKRSKAFEKALKE